MTDSAVVREATAGDAAAIGTVHAEAWRVGYSELFDAEFLDRAVRDRRSRWARQLTELTADGSTILVVEVNGDVVGFVHAGRCGDHGDVGEVFGFYVHPRDWGTGVAQRLFDDVAELLRSVGADRLCLWTHAGAKRARRFYERNGWSATGRTRDHDFGDGRPSPLVEYVSDIGR